MPSSPRPHSYRLWSRLAAATVALVCLAPTTAQAVVTGTPRTAPSTAAAAVSASTVPTGWFHWQGKYFTVWIPNRNWPVVESQNGLHVSSPTGTAEMSFGYATGGPAPYTLAGVRRLALSPQAGLAGARLLKTYAVRPLAGGQAQRSVFQATRTRDHAVVKGVVDVAVFSNYQTGAYAMAGQLYLAPAAQWSRWAPTLLVINDHFTLFPHTPQ